MVEFIKSLLVSIFFKPIDGFGWLLFWCIEFIYKRMLRLTDALKRTWYIFFDKSLSHILQKFLRTLGKEHFAHIKKIAALQKQYAPTPKKASTLKRILVVSIASLVSAWFVFKLNIIIFEDGVLKLGIFEDGVPKPSGSQGIVSLQTLLLSAPLVVSAPVAFVMWAFRDTNKLNELDNNRKDTNLKEFQKLQEWATGNIEGSYDEDKKISLQISALHSLRAYLKGEYGESFRRGAYEIFRSTLDTQHSKILKEVQTNDSSILEKISRYPLTQQINTIASEEWFSLLINHNFPTHGISLVGVSLSGQYLRHKAFGKSLDLTQAKLQGANLRSAQLQGANLRSAQLQGANLHRAQLQGADLRWAQLQGADLSRAQLQGADLSRAQLQGADLSRAQLQGASLSWAQLQGANLRSAQLQGADLDSAQLQSADLSRARLWAANLRSAQLQGVYSTDIDMYEYTERITHQVAKDTDLSGVNITPLSEKDKQELIATLKKLSNVPWRAQRTITLMEKNSSLSLKQLTEDAITGSYTKEEADTMIKEYNAALQQEENDKRTIRK